MRHQAIFNLYPEVKKVDWNGAYDINEVPVAIDEEKVKAEIERLLAEYDSKDYQRKRKEEYPSVADQLDLLYHVGYDGWKAAIQAVKDKYPKGAA